MPIDRSKYPDDWNAIALQIKSDAEWKCMICGKQCRRPGERFDTHKRTLTVAHLNHDESDCSNKNLLAACAPCHCRYDARSKGEHRKTGSKTALIKEDLISVQRATYKEARRDFMRLHNRWPRGVEIDAIWDSMPDIDTIVLREADKDATR